MQEQEPLLDSGSPSRRKNVVIIGAGAAGMVRTSPPTIRTHLTSRQSCAATLAQHPDNFKVTVMERAGIVGGQATSIPIDESKYGTSWMNDGVQGGSTIFKHTFNFFEQQGYHPQEVKLQVSFGKGPEGFWTNVFPSPLVDKYSADIVKFGKVLKIIKYLMPFIGLIPIRVMLRMFFFSKDFGDKMVYPLIALFLGTGNQTANVSCAILERLFDDPNLKLWEYSPDTLLPNLPTMVTFPNLGHFYEDWRKDLIKKGVDIRLSTEVAEVVSRNSEGVTLKTRGMDDEARERIRENGEGGFQTETFDELVMCVLADDALKILGKSRTWKERLVLGGATFYDDITVTHSDSEYFNNHYETTFKPELCAKPKSQEQEDQVAFAKGLQKGPNGEPPGFRPMYYTKSYASDPKKIEMSFDCSNYQHQFRQDCPTGDGVINKPIEQHVFQSIFLNKQNSDMWTKDEINVHKVIEEKWWHQLGHRWQHYVRVVPGMMFINGKNKTLFAGSWTLVNMHELAVVSGVAAAYRLGADYVKFDDFAEDFFSKYLLASHGWIYSREEKRRKKND